MLCYVVLKHNLVKFAVFFFSGLNLVQTDHDCWCILSITNCQEKYKVKSTNIGSSRALQELRNLWHGCQNIYFQYWSLWEWYLAVYKEEPSKVKFTNTDISEKKFEKAYEFAFPANPLYKRAMLCHLS